MNLYLFPEIISTTNGYGIIINNDYTRLNINSEDYIIWYSTSQNKITDKTHNFLIQRPSKYSIKRIVNILQGRLNCEVLYNEIYPIIYAKNINEIFCGDIHFYRTLRKIYPTKIITVRFHNCFSRIYDRKKLLKIDLDLKFNINLIALSKLEKEIFLDKNVKKIFLSKEDSLYYKLLTGNNDSIIWGVEVTKPNDYQIKKNKITKLVWFGGIDSHKKRSVDFFVHNIFKELRKQNKNITLHMYGRGSEKYNNCIEGVVGHGFYNKKDYPYKNESLYVNPDIIGGGVKIKLKNLIENNIPFISTPFGFEGYDKNLINDNTCIVKNFDNWIEEIMKFIS